MLDVVSCLIFIISYITHPTSKKAEKENNKENNREKIIIVWVSVINP
jgi:hypothetical protein